MFWNFNENTLENTPILQLLCSSAYTDSRTFASHAALPELGWGCIRSWEREQPGQLTQTDPGCPILCGCVFVFPRNYHTGWGCFPENGLWMGRSKWIPFFAVLAHVAFVLPKKLLLSQSTSSHTLTFLISLPQVTQGELHSAEQSLTKEQWCL